MRGFVRRRPLRFRGRGISASLRNVIAAAVSIGFFYMLSVKMAPLVETIATGKAVNQISLAVVEETDSNLGQFQMTYQDFVDVRMDSGGLVTSLSFRTAESARFKRSVLEGLVMRLESIDPDLLSVPMGNLTGIVLFSAKGPSVRVRVQSIGGVTAKYRSEFTSAGLNQTKHSIYLDLSITVYLLIPGKIVPVEVVEQVCVAETVIVGQVPDSYLNLRDGVN